MPRRRRYAQGTTVAAEKSRGEIEAALLEFGATKFGYMSGPTEAFIAFEYREMGLRFRLPLPSISDDAIRYTQTTGPRYRWRERTDVQIENAYRAEVRRRWRCLYDVIGAKLTAVEDGIETFEQAFLAYFNVGGHTLAERIIPQLEEAVRTGSLDLPLMLVAPNEGP